MEHLPKSTMKLFVLLCCLGAAAAIESPFVDSLSDTPALDNDADEETSGVLPMGRNACVCPITTIAENLADPVVLKATRKQLVNKLWNGTTPVLTPNGNAMKEQILLLLNSDVVAWNRNAYIMSALTWELLPFANMTPSLCQWTDLVNAAWDWETKTDGTTTHLALDNLITYFSNSTLLTERRSLIKAGCRVSKASHFKVAQGPPCNANTAKVNELWDLRGDWLPCSYKVLTKMMYASGNYSNKVMAVAATLALSGAVQDLFDENVFDQSLLVMHQRLLSSDKIPSCCCKERTALLMNINNKRKTELQRVINLIKPKYPKK